MFSYGLWVLHCGTSKFQSQFRSQILLKNNAVGWIDGSVVLMAMATLARDQLSSHWLPLFSRGQRTPHHHINCKHIKCCHFCAIRLLFKSTCTVVIVIVNWTWVVLLYCDKDASAAFGPLGPRVLVPWQMIEFAHFTPGARPPVSSSSIPPNVHT